MIIICILSSEEKKLLAEVILLEPVIECGVWNVVTNAERVDGNSFGSHTRSSRGTTVFQNLFR